MIFKSVVISGFFLKWTVIYVFKEYISSYVSCQWESKALMKLIW